MGHLNAAFRKKPVGGSIMRGATLSLVEFSKQLDQIQKTAKRFAHHFRLLPLTAAVCQPHRWSPSILSLPHHPSHSTIALCSPAIPATCSQSHLVSLIFDARFKFNASGLVYSTLSFEKDPWYASAPFTLF
jgi:hypothetical protein